MDHWSILEGDSESPRSIFHYIPPKSIQELSNHSHRAQFEEAQKVAPSDGLVPRDYTNNRKHTRGQPILGCMYTKQISMVSFRSVDYIVVWGRQHPGYISLPDAKMPRLIHAMIVPVRTTLIILSKL
jgi:hypothetical protein